MSQLVFFFLEWLLGFTEGDGNFQVVKFPTKSNPLNTRPVFTLNQQEPQVLYTIKSCFKFGTVIQIKPKKNIDRHYRYRVYKLEHIRQLLYYKKSLFIKKKAYKKAYKKAHNIVFSSTNKVRVRFDLWIQSYNTLCNKNNRPEILPVTCGDHRR